MSEQGRCSICAADLRRIYQALNTETGRFEPICQQCYFRIKREDREREAQQRESAVRADWRSCAGCGKRLLALASEHGGVLCEACAEQLREAEEFAITGDPVAMDDAARLRKALADASEEDTR